MSKGGVLYKYIRVAGLVSSLPFILAAGPFAGFFIGDYLKQKFNLQEYIIYIFIVLGAASSLNTTVRIIIMLKNTSKRS